MKNFLFGMSLCVTIFVIYSCERESSTTDSRLDALKSAFDSIRLQLEDKKEFGPFYSKKIIKKNKQGEIESVSIYCFTITGEVGKKWKLRIEFYVDIDNDGKADIWFADTDGNGKWDHGKMDVTPDDGKIDQKWKDKNGDGVTQGDEIEVLDPTDQTEELPMPSQN